MKVLLFSLLFTGFATTAWAQSVELGVEGGVMEADSQHAQAAWGLRGGVTLNSNLRLQARYLETGLSGNESLRELGGQARVSLLPFALTPYGFVGIARRWLSEDGAWFVPFGGGLDVPLAPFFRIAPEFTWHHLVSTPSAIDPTLASDGWNVSVVLHFDL
jgi:hypothetical protein